MAQAQFVVPGCEHQPGGIVTGFVARKRDGSGYYPTDTERSAFNFPTARSARKAAKNLVAKVWPDQAAGAEVRIV